MDSNTNILPRFLLFWKRLVKHYFFGTQPAMTGENWEQRCKRYIMALNRPDYGMRGRIALEELRRDSDLLCEEAALLPGPLQLQLLVLKLAATEPGARQFMPEMFEKPPVVKLFFSVLSQAEIDERARSESTSQPIPILRACSIS